MSTRALPVILGLALLTACGTTLTSPLAAPR